MALTQSSDETDPPLVSVLVPLFNGATTLGRAVASLQAQTLGSIEILVIDDASTDDGAHLAENLAAVEPRLRLLRQSRNGGPARARNRGLTEARGPWVALLDADDTWHPERLARLLGETDAADMVYDNLLGIDPQTGEETGPVFPQMPRSLSVATLVAAEAPGTTYNFGYLKPLMRRSFLRDHGLHYDETLRTGEDLVFTMQMLLAGARTRGVAEALYAYTTPVGHRSGRISALSHTRPRDRELHAGLQRLAQAYASVLSADDRAAIDERLAYLERIAPLAEFRHARLTGDWGRALGLVLREPEVRRRIFSRLR